MTGRDLIIYILENHLEDKPVFDGEKFIGFVTIGEAAAKLGIGVASAEVLFKLKILPGVEIGETIYIFGDYEKHARGEHENNN